MHYGTYYFTNIASVTTFTLCIGFLAIYMRRIVGLRWFAVAEAIGLIKLILQGIEGHAHVLLTCMTANELYLLAFVFQFMGFHWFVVRQPLRHRWPWILLASLLALYSVLYSFRIPYGSNVLNLPFVAVCALSARLLIRHGKGPFFIPSHCTAAVLLADMCVSGYRAILTDLHYPNPWETVNAQADPRWLYSLAGMAFLANFMVMCYVWFVVAEQGRVLAEQARTDPLTGTLNRRSMEECALRETSRSIRHGHALSIVMIDIDNFKRLNDTRGHAAGDQALQALSANIRAILRSSDLFARTGGEEFALLLPDTSATEGLLLAERIRRTIAELDIAFDTGPIRITISAGVTQLQSAYDDWEAMMRRADTALYAAKELGRNRVSLNLGAGMIRRTG